MPSERPHLTGVERTFGENEIIVSKTDPKGRITYANRVFLTVSGYTEPELLGKAHNILRHPDMPRCIFKFLWDTISHGQECFAYVLNRAKCGDHYWVFAHVTPTFDEHQRIIGYHSNRRVPSKQGVDAMRGVYSKLLQVENQFENPKQALAASMPVLVDYLKNQGVSYEELIFTLV